MLNEWETSEHARILLSMNILREEWGTKPENNGDWTERMANLIRAKTKAQGRGTFNQLWPLFFC
jgi:hypothetical protein